MLEKLVSKGIWFAARRIVAELRATRLVQQALVDTMRELGRLQPLYRVAPADTTPPPDTDAFIQPGDHLTYWILEELAKQFLIPITDSTNLEIVAKERGWVDPDGNLLMLPESAKREGLTLDNWKAIINE